jgi:stage II sporulation protein D
MKLIRQHARVPGLLALLLIVWFCPSGAAEPTFPVRIALMRIGLPAFFYVMPSDGTVSVTEATGEKVLFSGEAKVLMLKSQGNALTIFSESRLLATTKVPVRIQSHGKKPRYLWIGHKRKLEHAYRGTLMIVPLKNRLFALNDIDLEDYLRSVVPAEMGSKAPLPALVAQAIAARTYALRNLVRHSRQGFHLCDLEHCQAYRGITWESRPTGQAVEHTRNLVLTFTGKVANTVYHAHCGGELWASTRVWGGKDVPYLPSHPDRVGSGAIFCTWADRQYQPGAKKKGKGTPEKTTLPSSFLEVDGKTHLLKAPTDGPIILYSSSGKADYEPYTHPVRGHRVGMCQDGAVGMANAGHNALQILGFYYPGTKLQTVDGSTILTMPILEKSQAVLPPEIKSLAAAIPVQTKGSGKKVVDRVPFQGTKGKKSSDFRKWFWANMAPVLIPKMDTNPGKASKKLSKKSSKSKKNVEKKADKKSEKSSSSVKKKKQADPDKKTEKKSKKGAARTP